MEQKVKCPLLPNVVDKAICRERTYGPVFGEYDLHVMPGFKNVDIGLKSYSENWKMVSEFGSKNVNNFGSTQQTSFELSRN